MQVKDIMTDAVASCTRDTNLQDVAQLMVEHDCGALPIFEKAGSEVPVGIITDRDITCKAVARGKNPLELKAGDLMTSGCITVTPGTSLEDCCTLMEENQIRRVVVVDRNGACCGIVAQADLALEAPEHNTAKVVKRVSEPLVTSPAP